MISDQRPAVKRHTRKRGVIRYCIDDANFPDQTWGEEVFIMTRHSNGDRVLRAYCELNDEPTLIRDVVQRVDRDFHPQDAAVRLTEDDQFKGSAWYLFDDHLAQMQGFNQQDGRISDTRQITRQVRGFGNHSLMGDAWLVAKFDRSQGPGQQTFRNNPLTSVDHRGATGPALEQTETSTFEYFGEEQITVSVGTFACFHFAFVLVSNNHPPYHLWVTTDDFVFVKGTVEAPYNWSFELVEYVED